MILPCVGRCDGFAGTGLVGRFGLIVSKFKVLACVLMTTASAAILFASLGTVLAIRHFPLLVLLDMPAAAEPMDSIFAKAEPALRYQWMRVVFLLRRRRKFMRRASSP